MNCSPTRIYSSESHAKTHANIHHLSLFKENLRIKSFQPKRIRENYKEEMKKSLFDGSVKSLSCTITYMKKPFCLFACVYVRSMGPTVTS